MLNYSDCNVYFFTPPKEGRLCITPHMVKDRERRKDYYCELRLNRVIRSKPMVFIRPIYGIPASVLMLPVDVVGVTWTGVSSIFDSWDAIHNCWYPNLAEMLLYD